MTAARGKNSNLPRWVRISVALAVAALVAGLSAGQVLLPDAPAGTVSGDATHLFKKLGIIAIPRIAPPVDFLLSDLNGRRVRLSEQKGKVVLLSFWTTWCPDCRREMPGLEELHQQFKDRPFALLAVDLRESPHTVRTFFDRYRLDFAALLDQDGETARRFGIRSIPTSFIIDRDGAMIGKAIGSRPWDSSAAAKLFTRLIDNPPRNPSRHKTESDSP